MKMEFLNADGSIHKVRPKEELTVNRPERKLPLTFDQTLDKMRQIQEIERGFNLWSKELRFDFQTDRPFLPVMALSDLHIGSFDTDYPAIQKHLQFIKDNEVKLLLLGDLGDMFLPGKVPEGMQADTSIEMQLSALRQFFREYQKHILACVSDPSHVDWVRQVSGVDVYRWISEDLDIPLLESGGTLRTGVNDQEYTWSLWHQVSQYNSSLNPTHVHKRIVDRHSEDELDFVVTGHHHKGATEVNKTIRNRKRGLVQLGTFKTNGGMDKYARKGFVGGVQQHFPTFLLNSQSHDFEVIDSPEMAEMIFHIDQTVAQGILGTK
jgi:UDP-2,3-diacylglucosamine pyrophosphatase LpxH